MPHKTQLALNLRAMGKLTTREHRLYLTQGPALHSSLTMCDHFSSICRAYLELRRIVSVRLLFTAETAGELACSRILSGIDRCNSLLAGIILEDMQHPAARLMFRNKQQTNKQTSKNKHHAYVSPLPKKLHWLPIAERILYTGNSFIDSGTLLAPYHITSPANTKHWFMTPFLGGRCRKAVLEECPSCCLTPYSPSRSVCASSKKQTNKKTPVQRVMLKNAGCTILSLPSSSCLEFTAIEDPQLLVLVIFEVSTENTFPRSLPFHELFIYYLAV